MARLISNHGGDPTVAPAMREVPLESNTEALAFARDLAAGNVDIVIFLTGVGTRALTRVAETIMPREDFVAALRRAGIVARGPKPVAALQELGVPVTVSVPEPNTWHEVLSTLDARAEKVPLNGRRVGVQEYGVTNEALLAGLAERGARVTRVPVYAWALPEDAAPLRAAIHSLAGGEFEAILLTTSVQVTHLVRIAVEMGLQESMKSAMERLVVASIGPTTSEELRRYGIAADLEPSHPRMGILVSEAAERFAEIRRRKRSR
ncbi:MAG: uroporphyrinogen-III synthase [Acidobacteria bacterium]|nr:uroporphyrinogen-III synthase [Acidobacteriota bacterium]